MLFNLAHPTILGQNFAKAFDIQYLDVNNTCNIAGQLPGDFRPDLLVQLS